MQATETGIQHVNVKLFVKDASAVNLSDAVGVFQSWIQHDRLDDLLIDVADYRHVPEGPGVILVGHNAIYSLDEAEGRLGVLYNRRTVTEGGPQEQLKSAIEVTRKVCGMLAAEACFAGKLEFDTRSLQIAVNDRRLAPNTDDTLAALQPDIVAALKSALGDANYSLKRAEDSRTRFTVDITTDKPFVI